MTRIMGEGCCRRCGLEVRMGGGGGGGFSDGGEMGRVKGSGLSRETG